MKQAVQRKKVQILLEKTPSPADEMWGIKMCSSVYQAVFVTTFDPLPIFSGSALSF